MNVQQLVDQRRESWSELEQFCSRLSSSRAKLSPDQALRFAGLYRNACADLALAEAWKLPPSTVGYLQSLVARAHNRLYRSRSFDLGHWIRIALLDTPRQIFSEPAVHVCAILFWGLALLSGYLACNQAVWPDFAEQVLGTEAMEQMEQMYADADLGGGGSPGIGNSGNENIPAGTGQRNRSLGENFFMAGFYIRHNAGIGLECFASMVLVLPGFVTLTFNAVQLGAVDGYMLRPELGAAGVNFRNFTTAHGPFELTAIVLAAGAGLKIGMGWFWTRGLRRLDALLLAGRESLPIIVCAVMLFFAAALVEGFLSPLPDSMVPWWLKGLFALISSTGLMVYFVILGFPWNRR